MKKLFKASKNSTTLVGPADPYWSDVVAVFNMNDSFEGYSGIPGSTPSITQQTPDVGFVTDPGYKIKTLNLIPGKAARLNIPDGYITGDFTLEGYVKINNTGHNKYFIGANGASGISVMTVTQYPAASVYTPVGSIVTNSQPPWNVGWQYFAFIRNGPFFRVIKNGARTANDKDANGVPFDFRSIYLGTYGFDGIYYNYACDASFGPIRLTRRARYWDNFIPNWSTFLFPNHG